MSKTPPEAEVKLKPRTKAFIDLLDRQPTMSQTQAYIETHETNNPRTASVEASRTLASPKVIIYRRKHEQAAKQTMVEIATSKRAKHADRIKAAQDILDRNLGKATQRTEASSTVVNLNVEASQQLNDQFTEFLRNSTNQQ